MSPQILEIIRIDFGQEHEQTVKDELLSITLNHVMAASEHNLEDTRMAVLALAKGNPKQVKDYSACAKIDFRDVIMWAMEDKKNGSNP